MVKMARSERAFVFMPRSLPRGHGGPEAAIPRAARGGGCWSTSLLRATLYLAMREQSHIFSDTSPQAEAVLLEIYRRMPAWRKVELVDDAIRTARQLAMIGLRTRHPDETPARLQRRLLGLVLGEAVAEAIYGPVGTVP